MTESAGRQAIEQRWQALWVDGSNNPLTPTAYDNGPLLPAPDPTNPYLPPSGSPWVRLTQVHGAANQIEIGRVGTGTIRFRAVGLVDIDIFVPLGEGLGQAYTLADTAAAIWRQAQFDPGLLFFAPSVRRIRTGPDHAEHAQLKVSTTFWRDDLY